MPARWYGDSLCTLDYHGQLERPLTIARQGLAGIIDHDELFFDRLARQEIMVLAREGFRLAADIRQKRPVIADQCLPRDRCRPVRAIEGQVYPFVSLLDIVRAESRPLQVVPVHPEPFAALVNAVAQNPVVPMRPRRDGRHAPGAKCPPVVMKVHGIDALAFGEGARTYRVRIIPSVPESTGPELPGLPAQV